MVDNIFAPTLAICPNCQSNCCHPLDWEEHYAERWHLTVVCGNCEFEITHITNYEELTEFDYWLDDCLAEIHMAYLNLMRENLSEYADKFVAALNADALLPMDF